MCCFGWCHFAKPAHDENTKTIDRQATSSRKGGRNHHETHIRSPDSISSLAGQLASHATSGQAASIGPKQICLLCEKIRNHGPTCCLPFLRSRDQCGRNSPLLRLSNPVPCSRCTRRLDTHDGKGSPHQQTHTFDSLSAMNIKHSGRRRRAKCPVLGTNAPTRNLFSSPWGINVH
jgi:hypothetical protein